MIQITAPREAVLAALAAQIEQGEKLTHFIADLMERAAIEELEIWRE